MRLDPGPHVRFPEQHMATDLEGCDPIAPQARRECRLLLDSLPPGLAPVPARFGPAHNTRLVWPDRAIFCGRVKLTHSGEAMPQH